MITRGNESDTLMKMIAVLAQHACVCACVRVCVCVYLFLPHGGPGFKPAVSPWIGPSKEGEEEGEGLCGVGEHIEGWSDVLIRRGRWWGGGSRERRDGGGGVREHLHSCVSFCMFWLCNILSTLSLIYSVISSPLSNGCHMSPLVRLLPLSCCVISSPLICRCGLLLPTSSYSPTPTR